MLSDYFHLTLDELVKDVDVQDVREKSRTEERVASLYLDMENGKALCRKIIRSSGYITLAVAAFVLIAFLAHLAFPDVEWLWRHY